MIMQEKNITSLKKCNAGLGRADLVIVPYKTDKPGIIFELKVDSNVEMTIEQIKEKDYSSSFGNYHGNILLITISLDSKNN